MPGLPIDAEQAASYAPSQYYNSSSGTHRRRRTQLDHRHSRLSSAATWNATNPATPSDHNQFTIITPPPIDPGVFRCLKEIRCLVDDASELALRAASGLVDPGSPSLDKAHSAYGYFNRIGRSAYGSNNANAGGRKSTLPNIRANRLRTSGVQKLAEAYRLDEIATSVVIMKGTSALQDLADKVLRQGRLCPLFASRLES